MEQYRRANEDLFKHIVTDDKSWGHYVKPELEVSIVTDLHKIQIPAGSVLGYKRRPDIKFIVPWRTVNTVRYFVTLDKLGVWLLVGTDQDVYARMSSFCRTTLPKTQPNREKDLFQ